MADRGQGRSLTIWQQMQSPHMLPLARELARHFEVVRFITLSDIAEERMAIGWVPDKAEGVVHIHAATPAQRLAALEGFCSPRHVHWLPGLKFARWLHPVQRRLWASEAQILVGSETPWPARNRVAGLALAMRDRLLARLWRRRAAALLAVGEQGIDYFARCGFPRSRLIGLGYFPDIAAIRPEAAAAQPRCHRLFAAAMLLPHKGIDLLLAALGGLAAPDWTLTIAGDGPQRAALQRQAALLGIADRITWLGWVNASQIPGLLADATLAIVPSRYDGWGVITNEALGQGTPVIVSDAAGSHIVLGDPRLGGVFQSDSAAALAKALRSRMADGPTDADRGWIADWAQRHISPAVAADWLAPMLLGGDYHAPPPWHGG